MRACIEKCSYGVTAIDCVVCVCLCLCVCACVHVGGWVHACFHIACHLFDLAFMFLACVGNTTVLWDSRCSHSGECALHHDSVLKEHSNPGMSGVLSPLQCWPKTHQGRAGQQAVLVLAENMKDITPQIVDTQKVPRLRTECHHCSLQYSNPFSLLFVNSRSLWIDRVLHA